MSARIRNVLLVAAALILCAVFVAVTAGKLATVGAPKAPRASVLQNGDVSVRDAAPAAVHGAPAPAVEKSAKKKSTAPAEETKPANAQQTKPAEQLPRFDREPATEARVASSTNGIVLASIADPTVRMRIAPPETSPLSAKSAPQAASAKESSTSSAVSAAPAPAPTPSFCPVGTSMKQAKGTYGREKWCVKSDRGGIEIKDGPYLALWSDGKKRSEGNWLGGKQHGDWMEWYSTGKLSAQGEYRNGRREGNWAFYRESGKKAEEGTFKNGEKEGHWVVFDDAGHRAAEGDIRSDERVAHETGKWTWFWPNGTKKEEGTFHSGRRDGRWTNWDERGRVVSVNEYRDGEKE